MDIHVCEYTYARMCVLDLIPDNPKLLNTLSTFDSFPNYYSHFLKVECKKLISSHHHS